MLNNISKCILNYVITTYFNYKSCNCDYQDANNKTGKSKSKVRGKKVPIFPIPPIFKSLSLLASLKNSYSHTLMKGG